MKKVIDFVKFILTGLIIVILGIFLSGCISTPERLPGEPMPCYQNRFCIYGIVKTGNKDISGCTAVFAITCRKILVNDYCKFEYPDSQETCRERIN